MGNNVPKVAYDGVISIGNKELSCAVLEDGTRILTNTAVFKAFDRPRKGKPSEEYRLKNTPAFLTANNLSKYIEREFAEDDFSVRYINREREFIGLTKETGYQHLTQQISTCTTMMRGFDTWEEFEPVFRKAFNVPEDERI